MEKLNKNGIFNDQAECLGLFSNKINTGINFEEIQQSQSQTVKLSFDKAFYIQEQDYLKYYSLNKKFVKRNLLYSCNLNEIFYKKVNEEEGNTDGTNIGILQAKVVDDRNFITNNSNFSLHLNELSQSNIKYNKNYLEHTQRVNDFCLINDYSTFCSASDDATVKIWDLKGDNKSVKTFKTVKRAWSVCYSQNFICAAIERDVVVWDLRTLKPFGKLGSLHSEAILSLKIKEIEGKFYLISGGDDGLVNITSLNEPKLSLDSILYTINTEQTVVYANLLDLTTVMTMSSSEILNFFSLENNNKLLSFNLINESLDLNYWIENKDYDLGKSLFIGGSK